MSFGCILEVYDTMSALEVWDHHELRSTLLVSPKDMDPICNRPRYDNEETIYIHISRNVTA